MKQRVTKGIVLARTNYGEADRILTILTPDSGKLRVLAKGVRRIKSKMAGGIELFSINDITYIEGKGGLGTLISSRLETNYGNIVKDVNRTMYAYEVLKLINKVTEDAPEPEYFAILHLCLESIHTDDIALDYIRLWLTLHLLKLNGHSPNLVSDMQARSLAEGSTYAFSFDDMTFDGRPSGSYGSQHIKLLRLAERATSPGQLAHVQVQGRILEQAVQLTLTMLNHVS